MHYLYCITNLLNNKVYIGQTIMPEKRWTNHKYDSKKEKPPEYIHRAMAKYGVDNFTFKIIDFAFNRWQADCIEENLIKLYDSINKEKGYNLASGGSNGTMSEESKNKLSKAMKKRLDSGWRGRQKGSSHSYGDKISKSKLGHIVSDATKEKMRKLITGLITLKPEKEKKIIEMILSNYTQREIRLECSTSYYTIRRLKNKLAGK